MKTYIALLRGINVSGQKKIKMDALRKMFDKLAFEDVRTYIQSGNIVFNTSITSEVQVQQSIKTEIAKSFGFDVHVLVKSVNDLRKILEASPYTDPVDLEAKRVYYVLLKNAPSPDVVPNLDQSDYPNELFHITPSCVYLNCINGAGKARLTNNIIEKKLNVTATTRNHRTMLKLLEMASS